MYSDFETSGLHVTAVCDAGWSLFGEEPVPYGVAEDLAAHDLEMVKPALLYADKVTLRSGNFAIETQLADDLTRWHMPLQVVMRSIMLAADEGTRTQMVSRLPAGSIRFPSVQQARQELDILREAQAAGRDVGNSWIRGRATELWEEWGDYLASIGDVLVPAIERDLEAIQPAELALAVESGILEIEPHVPEMMSDGTRPFETLVPPGWLDAVSTMALGSALATIATSSGPLMLDRWGSQLDRFILDELGVVPKKLSRVDAALEVGMALLVDLPGVRRASVAEIIDIRSELEGPLVRLRSALVRAAVDAPLDSGGFEEFVRELRIREIEPAMVELSELAAQDTFLSALLRTAPDPRDLVVPVGGVVLAAGLAGPLAPLGVLAAAAGLVPSLLVAQRNLAERRAEMRANPFYFLHRLG